MVDRIKAAVDAKTDSDFYIMARTDAFQKEGLNAAIDRAAACVEAGADAIPATNNQYSPMPARVRKW